MPDTDKLIEAIFEKTRSIPGFLADNEARFLGVLASCAHANGHVVEIGSFKGKSTVMLASIAAEFGDPPVVAIDPHAGLSYLGEQQENFLDPTFEEFLKNIRAAGIESHVEVRRTFSRDVATNWNRPIRLLWIDGDHTYRGAKEDFELFLPFLAEGAIVALHDSLNTFEGPIRVFVEEILRSDRFGPSGFVHSIAWSQYRPADGARFRIQRQKLAQRAAKLLPFVANDTEPSSWRKKLYKFHRSRVPRKYISTAEFAALLGPLPGGASSVTENRRPVDGLSASSSSGHEPKPTAPDIS